LTSTYKIVPKFLFGRYNRAGLERVLWGIKSDLISITLIWKSLFRENVAMGQLAKVPIGEIRENPVALRTVNREGEAYLGLVDSIKEKGFLGALTVRKQRDEETGTEFYELIDGLHRLSASRDAGIEEINVDIVDLDNAGVMEAQIMTNIHKVETKPVEYSRQLRRLLAMNHMMTESELAAKLGKSSKWIADRLGLNKIENEQILGLINEGKINLSNAYALAKLPSEEQQDWVEKAMTETPDVFVPACSERIKAIKAAAKAGKDASAIEFSPTPHMQKLGDVKDELASGKVAKALGIKDAATWKAAIEWVLHLDPKSVEAQKSKFDQQQAEKAERKKQRQAEAAKKKTEKAEKAAAEAKKAQAEAEAAAS
jgi:ParB family chromosome partitioning protein